MEMFRRTSKSLTETITGPIALIIGVVLVYQLKDRT